MNHCLNCANADIHDGKFDWFICCQKRMQKMTEIEINCKDFKKKTGGNVNDKDAKKSKQTRGWDELKEQGSDHYKTGGVEPIDLYLAGGMFTDFALCSIIKYAFRQRECVNARDLDKIIDYAQKLKAAIGE